MLLKDLPWQQYGGDTETPDCEAEIPARGGKYIRVMAWNKLAGEHDYWIRLLTTSWNNNRVAIIEGCETECPLEAQCIINDYLQR